ncbi:phytanoyl-CoA dioxygenase family protein [Wenzhouxiangella sp. XN79A]|uniref:phytanoyl-CoA dioxygenase family protein n=1 Tax=Wenzhouxiangella sp. XN79A TaxID=2724193 RepID=UPI00144ABB98|nr:phytanoyl-CoA dioxygenase family protein [Wenzhouxiangella sp. XN79A]NKI35894.1 phytanoyl-CoA dioxygenase family protein [Wenzhouxiangella sp. XN79A]
MDDSISQQFGQDGYWVARGLCPADRVAAMRAAAEAALARRRPPFELESEVGYPGAPSIDAPGSDTIRRLLDALALDPLFFDWACDPQLVGRVRKLLDAGSIRVVRAHHNCVMTKLPEFSSATGWHQDLRYWAFERPELITAWTALGFEAEGNGGMRVIPGSHRAGLEPERFDAQRFFRTDLPANRDWLERAVQVDLEPGDVLFFHAGLLHAAGANRTDRRKLSVVFSYRATDNPPRPGSRSAARPDLDPDRPADFEE